MGKEEMKQPEVVARMATSWQRAVNAARRTQGKEPIDHEPRDRWKAEMLLAEHSPIRLVEYDISYSGIRQWVTVHLVRHWLGFIPFVHSQREDRRKLDCSRDELPQGSLNDMDISANAQALINVSRKRLCFRASKETREAWEATREAIRKVDHVMADKMVRNCVYSGFCRERKQDCCGFVDTPKFKEEVEQYRSIEQYENQ